MVRGKHLLYSVLVLFALSLVCTPILLAQQAMDLSSAGLPSGLQWKAKDVGTSDSEDPAKPDYNDADWADVEVPMDLSPDIVGENTNFWYRLTGLKIPADWPRDRYLILYDFNVDDNDVTYFNGQRIGSTSGWNVLRKYIIPPEIVNWTGTNTIAIFGSQGTGGSGMSQSAPVLEPGSPSTGIIRITAIDPKKMRGVAGIPITVKVGTETYEVLSEPAGTMIFDVAPGSGTIEVQSQPWIGTVKPEGPQPITVKGGQIVQVEYTVEPYIYRIVKADKPMKMDGNLTEEEWGGAMAMVVNQPRQLAAVGGGVTADDCSAIARWKWDDNYIYAAIEVIDDFPRMNTHITDDDGNLWQGDGVETYIQLDPYDPKRSDYRRDRNYQWTIGVGDPPQWKIFRDVVGDVTIASGGIPNWQPDHMAVVLRSAPDKKPGYIVEARFPWTGLPDVDKTMIPPKEGTEGAIGLAVNDTDEEGLTTRENQIMWNGYGDLWTNPAHFTPALWAGPPVAVVLGDINGDGKVTIPDVTITLQLAVGVGTPTSAQLAAGDLNKNGKIDIADVIKILRAAVGIEKLQ
ncbi:MAG: sugar-binding protein [Armatimonadota bacterium]